MDRDEPLDPNVPGGSPSASSRDPAPETSHDPAATPVPRTRSRGILRRLLARWWHILLLSYVVVLPVWYLIYLFVGPTYEAFSILRVEPTQPELYGSLKTGFVESRSVGSYLETQVNVIISDRLLGEVVANPSVVKLPVITGSKDPKVDLRKKITVENIDGTYLIRVALELADGEDAAMIVNTVVDAYLRQNNEFNRGKNMNLQKSLRAQLDKLGREFEEKKRDLDKLDQEARVVLAKPVLNPNALKDDDDQTPQPAFSSVTEEQFTKLADIFIQCELEYFDALSELNAVQSVRERSQDAINEHLETRVAQEFKNDPKVDALIERIAESWDQLKKAIGQAPPIRNPTVLAAQAEFEKRTKKYQELWNDKYDGIRQRLIDEGQGVLSQQKLRELEVAVEKARRKKIAYAQYLDQMKVQDKTTNNNTFVATILNHELESLLNRYDQVKKNLAQLQFEALEEAFQVVLLDKASVPKTPTNNNLVKYMAAAPLVVFFLILGLFLVQEIVAGREAAPEPARQPA